jgi:hypothetical protein
MTDLTQPATAAEFLATGVDAATAESLAMQANMMAGRTGTRDQQIELAVGMRHYVPPAQLAPTAKTTPEAATAALHAHTNAQLTQELSAVMAPPASPSEYRLPGWGDNQTDEQFATDREVAASLHAEGFPRHLVEGIGRDLATAAASRAHETPQQAQARIATTTATLQKWYGKDLQANLQLVDGVVDRLLAKGGATRAFVENVMHHLDASSIDALVQFAKHRAARR